MEGLDLPNGVGGGLLGTLAFSIIMIGGGIAGAVKWFQKNRLDNANSGAQIDSIATLQAMLRAERENNASLRTENQALQDRADRFATERNELIIKIGEMSGELRAVKAELEQLRADVQAMRGHDGQQTP